MPISLPHRIRTERKISSPASAANASDFVQIPIANVPAEDTRAHPTARRQPRPVYHGENGLWTVRELTRSYQTISRFDTSDEWVRPCIEAGAFPVPPPRSMPPCGRRVH